MIKKFPQGGGGCCDSSDLRLGKGVQIALNTLAQYFIKGRDDLPPFVGERNFDEASVREHGTAEDTGIFF